MPLSSRFETLLTKDELAGLACCPDVEARVVRGGRYVYNAGKGWDVQSVVYSIITLFIIIGNVGFLVERRRKQTV